MFYKSKITGKIYKCVNDVYTIVEQNDTNSLYQEQLEWLINGNAIDYFDGTEIEIAEANKVVVPEKVTSIQFFIELELNGITEDMIKNTIEYLFQQGKLTLEQKVTALISINKANFIERANPLVSIVGMAFEKTNEQMDEIFINADKRQLWDLFCL